MDEIRAGDIVLHKPTDEEWVVCGVNYESGELVPCGYPFPSMADIDDCVLIESCGEPQSEIYKDALRDVGLESFVEVEK